MHIEHARYLLVLHPDKFSYTKKSFMVYRIEACNLKLLQLIKSYVCILFFHSSFRSSIKDRRYISISLSSFFGPKINSDIKINGYFMHFQGDTLYTTSIIGHMLHEVLILPKRLNPSVARSSRILRGSLAKCGCFASKSFNTKELAEWLSIFSSRTHCS